MFASIAALGGKFDTALGLSQTGGILTTYRDELILITLPTQTAVQIATIDSIKAYFQAQGKTLSIIFAAYLTATALIALFFFFSKYFMVNNFLRALQ